MKKSAWLDGPGTTVAICRPPDVSDTPPEKSVYEKADALADRTDGLAGHRVAPGECGGGERPGQEGNRAEEGQGPKDRRPADHPVRLYTSRQPRRSHQQGRLASAARLG